MLMPISGLLNCRIFIVLFNYCVLVCLFLRPQLIFYTAGLLHNNVYSQFELEQIISISIYFDPVEIKQNKIGGFDKLMFLILAK